MNAERNGSLNAGERMYALVPGWTRARDRLAGGVLQQLLNALGVGVDAVRTDVLRLLDDMFVDTCAAELVPLIGDLVGESLDPRIPVARQRYQVKQALHWRRRKGTPAQLEALAWIVSGFRSRVLEAPFAAHAAPRTARILGTSPAAVHMHTRVITGSLPIDVLRLELDVVWPVRQREILLTPLEPSGADLHALRPTQDIGLRRADGTAIFRSDDPRTCVGPGLDVEVLGIGGDLEQLGRLTPRFVDLGGATPPQVPHYTLAIDPERGRVAGPTAVVASAQRMRRYRLRFWEPMRAEQVVARPFHLGDGIYTFAEDGGDRWLTDDQANKLNVFEADLCSGTLQFLPGERTIVARLGGAGGCTADATSPYVLLEPNLTPLSLEAALASGLPLDVAGLRRFFTIEDAWGWDLFTHIRLVRRFSREAPADDTVEVDLRHGRFRIGPAHIGSPLTVRYFRPYDIDEIRSRVRDVLLHAVPLGRRAVVTFLDTAVPGYSARKLP